MSNKFPTLFLIIFCKISFGASLYNLSPLFPLAINSYDELPGLSLKSCSREFFGQDLLDELPKLFLTNLEGADYYKTLRLLSIRFDPINEETRLIFQPLLYDTNPFGKKILVSVDASLHLFFKLSVKENLNLINKMETRFPNLPLNFLGVHPGFSKAPEVESKILDLLCQIADAPLFKATYMTVRNGGVLWHFGGYHVSDHHGVRTLGLAVDIANVNQQLFDSSINHQVQRVFRGSGQVNAVVAPLASNNYNLSDAFISGDNVFSTFKINKIRSQVDAVENPNLTNPHKVDCASCHASETLRRKLELDYKKMSSKEMYNLPNDISLDKSIDPKIFLPLNNFRSFGYFDFSPVISRRVLNETYQIKKRFY